MRSGSSVNRSDFAPDVAYRSRYRADDNGLIANT